MGDRTTARRARDWVRLHREGDGEEATGPALSMAEGAVKVPGGLTDAKGFRAVGQNRKPSRHRRMRTRRLLRRRFSYGAAGRFPCDDPEEFRHFPVFLLPDDLALPDHQAGLFHQTDVG